jgi:hypothetical protein
VNLFLQTANGKHAKLVLQDVLVANFLTARSRLKDFKKFAEATSSEYKHVVFR